MTWCFLFPLLWLISSRKFTSMIWGLWSTTRNTFQGEEYKLFWPEQTEFVRMAARFGAKIVPFGVVGEDDFFEVRERISLVLLTLYHFISLQRITAATAMDFYLFIYFNQSYQVNLSLLNHSSYSSSLLRAYFACACTSVSTHGLMISNVAYLP